MTKTIKKRGRPKKNKLLLEGDITSTKRPSNANGGIATQREQMAECVVSSPNSNVFYVILDMAGIQYKTKGDTIDEAILEITAAAQTLIELYKEEGLEIPLKAQKERAVVKPLTVPVIVAV